MGVSHSGAAVQGFWRCVGVIEAFREEGLRCKMHGSDRKLQVFGSQNGEDPKRARVINADKLASKRSLNPAPKHYKAEKPEHTLNPRCSFTKP